MIWNHREYETVIGYGIGQYYEKTKEELNKVVKLDYLCDKKWVNVDDFKYDGIKVIQPKKMQEHRDALVIVFSGNSYICESIKDDLNQMGVMYVHVDEILNLQKEWNGKQLKEKFPDGKYRDTRGNEIYFDSSLPDQIRISFQGEKNELTIDPDVTIGSLYIEFGNSGYCSIGRKTKIIDAYFAISDAEVKIGKDCLFSSEIILRTHDFHHIFDFNSHERINYAKDIIIEDNVWLAHRVSLLAGAKIGTGSVVGTCAVTSSQFGSHMIIAGCPAKVIRENICWSKDSTEYFNHSTLEECISKDALKYL